MSIENRRAYRALFFGWLVTSLGAMMAFGFAGLLLVTGALLIAAAMVDVVRAP